jgi:hypothetical protein
VEITLHDLADPPLPKGPLIGKWGGYMTAWAEGRRADAQATLADFVERLTAAPTVVVDGFSAWLCELVFDRSRFWAGQWGGGMTLRGGTWEKPAAPALTVHLLSIRVVLPYLLAALPEERTPHLRWLYQFTIGQGYRLPPADRRRLFSAIEEHCGPGTDPVDLLARASSTDPVARQLLRDTTIAHHGWPGRTSRQRQPTPSTPGSNPPPSAFDD